jgi:hypothetical protein
MRIIVFGALELLFAHDLHGSRHLGAARSGDNHHILGCGLPLGRPGLATGAGHWRRITDDHDLFVLVRRSQDSVLGAALLFARGWLRFLRRVGGP